MNHELHSRVHAVDLVLIAVFCIAFFGYRLGSYVPLTDHEGYVAVTAQEALDEGHWIIPHFDGQIRLQKTPLMYWAVAGTAKVLGSLNEFVIRLPSALAASGTALVLTIMITMMFSRVSGLIAGLATASAVGMLWQSHVGTADMLMTFFVVASMLFFYLGIYEIDLGRPAAKYLVPGYVCFALGMLAKGPVPIIAVVIPLFFYLAWAGLYFRWQEFDRYGKGTLILTVIPLGVRGLWRFVRRFNLVGAFVIFVIVIAPWLFLLLLYLLVLVVPMALRAVGGYLKKFHLVLGLIIFLVIVGAWVVPVLIKLPDAVWRWKAEYLERYLGDFGTERPWWYYFPQIFLLTLPWSVFLPIGLVLPFRRDLVGKRYELMFLFMWLVAGFFFFSLSGGKRAHYILPIVPPAIALSTVGMIFFLEHVVSRKGILIGGIVIIVLTSIAALVGYRYVGTAFPQVLYQYRLMASILVFAEILALLFYFRFHLLMAVTTIALAAGFIFAIAWPLYPAVTDPNRDPKLAAERIKRALPADAEVYSIGKANGPLVFYTGRKMLQLPQDRELEALFKDMRVRHRDAIEYQIQMSVIDRVLSLMRRPQCVFFVTSDARFLTAQSHAEYEHLPIYEILRLPRYFTDEKSLVMFSNCPKREAKSPATTSTSAPAIP